MIYLGGILYHLSCIHDQDGASTTSTWHVLSPTTPQPNRRATPTSTTSLYSRHRSCVIWRCPTRDQQPSEFNLWIDHIRVSILHSDSRRHRLSQVPVLMSKLEIMGRIFCGLFFFCLSFAGISSIIAYIELTARTIQDFGGSETTLGYSQIVGGHILGGRALRHQHQHPVESGFCMESRTHDLWAMLLRIVYIL
ncbi:hypothetical protein TcWFU_005448 [Taenia crassiceps]|uniref:Uncharacterized protein n=1 Tax=Taenia crassiceps TaxID=6207 RepID=A0ABR4QH44_9CEST